MLSFSRNAAILIFVTVSVLSMGLSGISPPGAGEPLGPVLISAVGGVSTPVREAAVDDTPAGKKFAVIIGIVYDNNELGRIKFADRDADSLYDLLTKKLGFPRQNVILLKNEQATNENIRNALSWLAENPEIDASSDVVFFYSGHGLRNGERGELKVPGLPDGYAMVPFDFQGFDYKNGIGLFFDWYLAEHLSRISPARMWVTVDSCFSAGFDRPGISGPNRVLTLSSQANQLSGELHEVNRGVFTHYVIDEGVARGKSVEEAFLASLPGADHYGQNPHISDNYPGNLDFSRPR
ncbi:MAG: caspase family protein [Thermoleophilia bacterium]|nr:caspase family protein [Thermoleophilia bacterium]